MRFGAAFVNVDLDSTGTDKIDRNNVSVRHHFVASAAFL